MTFRTVRRRGYPLYVKSATQLYIDKLLHSGMNVLWDGSTSVFEDTSLTDLAENNDDVAGWKDLGSNGYHVTEATTKPVYNTPGLNNRPFVNFNRVNGDLLSRSLTNGILAVTGRTTYTLFAVWKSTSTVLLPAIYGEGGASATNFVSLRINSTTPGNIIFQHRDDAVVTSQIVGGTSLNNGALHLATARRISATSWDLRVDGVSVGTDNDNVGASTTSTIVVGGLYIGGAFGNRFEGDIFMVGISFTDSYATLEPQIAARYGITI